MDLYHYSAGFIASLVAMLIASLGGYILFYQRWFWITLGASVVIARWASAPDAAPSALSKRQGEVKSMHGWRYRERLSARDVPQGLGPQKREMI